MTDGIAYDAPGALTALPRDFVEQLPHDPIELCRAAQSLLTLPELALASGVSEERIAEKSIRPARAILERALALDPAPLGESRSSQRRVVGTCRHFALLSCAFLRARGIEARARCGFATYFVPEKYVDHWIVEYRHAVDARWVRVDSEILGFPFVKTPEDLRPGEFLTGGESWVLCRDSGVDGMLFGVVGAPHAWGIAEVRGNAIRDLAALNKVEMLPWDEWGRMAASYAGETGPEYDALISELAAVSAANDPAAIADLYGREDLAVPPAMIV